MEKLQEQLKIYEEKLLYWNEQINLTAIKEPAEIKVKHFEDSLTILKHINIPENESFIDIGTGAGFPGMVVKLARPDLDVTLLDGHKKRFIFLEDLQNTLGVHCNNLHGRAEEAVKNMRELYRITSYHYAFVQVGTYTLSTSFQTITEPENVVYGKQQVSNPHTSNHIGYVINRQPTD